MSRLLSATETAHVQPVSLHALPGQAGSFRARFADGQEIAAYRPQGYGGGYEEPADALEQARADAFAEGFEAGARTTREAYEAEDAARLRLAQALEQLEPGHDGALSAMLSAAVMRLVTRIVGEVEVDADLLRRRVEAIAAFIEEEQGRNALHVHPDDLPLLSGCAVGVPIETDAALSRGSVRLNTADGWVEDGPDVQLSRLKSLLDDMEGKG